MRAPCSHRVRDLSGASDGQRKLCLFCLEFDTVPRSVPPLIASGLKSSLPPKQVFHLSIACCIAIEEKQRLQHLPIFIVQIVVLYRVSGGLLGFHQIRSIGI